MNLGILWRTSLSRLASVSVIVAPFSAVAAPALATEKDLAAVVISAPRPEYPYAARRDNISGSGVVRIHVDPATGNVARAEMAQSTGSAVLDQAALSALRRWRFRPGAVTTAETPVSFERGGASYASAASRSAIPDHLVQSLLAATTPTGRRLAEPEVRSLILHAPMPMGTATRSANWRLKVGVFLLAVRPDGSVSNVETLQRTGHGGLDREVIDSLKRWRFRPNSVSEVRVPAAYVWRPL